MNSTARRRRPPRFAVPARVVASAVAGLVAGLTVLTGCSNDAAEPSPDAFCATARQNPELITNPPLSTPEEIDQSIEFYRLMGQLAPIEIAPEWNQLLTAMETADELVPDNPESEQLVAQTAFASELAAVRVKEWMAERCGIDLPITTIVSHDTGVTAGSTPTDPASQTDPSAQPSTPSATDPASTASTTAGTAPTPSTTTETTAAP